MILHYYSVLQSTPPVRLYYEVLHLPRKVTLELHQVLHLTRKMTPMLDPCHILWNVIYNARSNGCHPPTSPNIAPAKQNDSYAAWFSSHVKCHFQCAEQQVSHSHLILRLPRKTTSQNSRENVREQVKCHFQCGDDLRPFRDHSDHETVSPQPATEPRLLFGLASHIFYWKM